MANTRLHYNDLRATLSGTHTSGATTLNFAAALTHANGTNVPTLAGGDYFLLSVLDASGNLVEIVKVTGYTSGGTSATVVRAQEGTPATAFTASQKVVGAATAGSLTGDSAWTAPTLTNGYSNYGAPFASAGYRKFENGLVVLRGAVQGGSIGTSTSVAICQLPAGYRPSSSGTLGFKVAGDSSNTVIRVDTSGYVIPAVGLASYVSLDGVSFYTEA